MKLLPCILCCAVLSGQAPAARSHFKNAQGLFEEHDDTGDALAEAEREFRLALKAAPNYAAAQHLRRAVYQGVPPAVLRRMLRHSAQAAAERVGQRLRDLAVRARRGREPRQLDERVRKQPRPPQRRLARAQVARQRRDQRRRFAVIDQRQVAARRELVAAKQISRRRRVRRAADVT